MKKGKTNEVITSDVLTRQGTDMPMLEYILNTSISEIQSEVSKSLNFTVDFNLESVLQLNSKDYIELLDGDTNHISTYVSIASFNTNPFYIVVSKDFAYKLIEISLGGQKVENKIQVKDRIFSKIEQTIIDNFFATVVLKLQNAFRVIDSKILFLQCESNYSRSEIKFERPTNLILCRTVVTIKESISKLDIVIPYDTLLPMKTSLMKSFSNNKLIQNEIWSRHLRSFILDNEVKLKVEIAVDQPLSTLQKMKVGDVIMTDKDHSDTFDVSINGVKIYDCKIGKMSEKIAAEIIDKGM